MDPLTNVIWKALTTRQVHFAESGDVARRFIREVSPLCAFPEPNDDGYASLATLVGPQETAGIFLDQVYEARPGWQYIAGAPLLQMVSENGVESRQPPAEARSRLFEDQRGMGRPPEIVALDSKNSPDMLELTALTKPGPFGTRTHELGYYAGIRQAGKLVAMAGERLKVPGYTEVSAVCTHPDHLGKGYARALMSDVMARIRARGETPFLHVRSDNARAIALYERLGFKKRREGHFAVLRRTS